MSDRIAVLFAVLIIVCSAVITCSNDISLDIADKWTIINWVTPDEIQHGYRLRVEATNGQAVIRTTYCFAVAVDCRGTYKFMHPYNTIFVLKTDYTMVSVEKVQIQKPDTTTVMDTIFAKP